MVDLFLENGQCLYEVRKVPKTEKQKTGKGRYWDETE